VCWSVPTDQIVNTRAPLAALAFLTCSRTGWRHWWRRPDSNRRPPPCKSGALPAELRPHVPASPRRYRKSGRSRETPHSIIRWTSSLPRSLWRRTSPPAVTAQRIVTAVTGTAGTGTSGRLKENVEPFPGAETSQIRPPRAQPIAARYRGRVPRLPSGAPESRRPGRSARRRDAGPPGEFLRLRRERTPRPRVPCRCWRFR
jgi:hypothetical protein